MKIANITNTARVWIYQSDKLLTPSQVAEIQQLAQNFAQQWESHHQKLDAEAVVLHQRFLILIVDENQAEASGCSIDKSVAFVRNIGAHYNLDFFDRLQFAYLDENNSVLVVHKDDFSKFYQTGKINDDTLVFDNLIKTYQELETNWLKPLKHSWHKRFVG